MYRPLADEIRPKTIDEVVGQRHILGENGVLRRVIQGGTIPNMIFYGPSGTGKTTVAEIAAARIGRPFYRLNATTASLADVKAVMADVGTLLAPEGVVLYLDEIQYFNKKQQQSLLEFMENGKLTLIASTTENPYFYVFNAVLSRSTVFEFKPVSPEEVLPMVLRGIRRMGERQGVTVTWEDGVPEQVARACGGDVRKSLNAVEALFAAHALDLEDIRLTLEETGMVAQRSAMRYDRDGDSHYDILSAFQKSIRGSDPDAAIHYLARLLEAGDLISPCRRLMVIASEDIGLAHPQAVSVVKGCVDSANMLGLPEARIPLAQAVIYLATLPKSNAAICAIDEAMADVRAGKTGDIPANLRDAHYGGAAKLGHGLDYKYAHSYPNHYVKQQYLPDALKDRVYYHYGENKTEQAAKRYWDAIKGQE
ncbi:MAG: replication-associated recombination protein A [Ruminiclostridium sp.]|nr:replication-associated recombination protein A [Ruminiclostridium sp.]